MHVPMFVASALQGVENAAQGMRQIEQLSDADVAEVHQSESLFKAVESATADLRGFLDTLGGLRWLTAGMKVRQRAQFRVPAHRNPGRQPHPGLPPPHPGPRHPRHPGVHNPFRRRGGVTDPPVFRANLTACPPRSW